MVYVSTISFEEAKKLAEEVAGISLKWYKKDDKIPFLSERFEEAECCWFFFRNSEILGPIEESLTWNHAYAVSKKGTLHTIADFSNDSEKLKEYLKLLSYYFKRKNI